jgi:hypothetical protein
MLKILFVLIFATYVIMFFIDSKVVHLSVNYIYIIRRSLLNFYTFSFLFFLLYAITTLLFWLKAFSQKNRNNQLLWKKKLIRALIGIILIIIGTGIFNFFFGFIILNSSYGF